MSLKFKFLLGLFILFCSHLVSFATPHFLYLPFKDTEVRIQQGWVYNFGDTSACAHQGIDYVKGTESSSTWKAFDVYPAADGEATLRTSTSYGDYITVKTIVDNKTYYTLYAHLDSTQRKLSVNTPTSVTKDKIIGVAGKTGTASNNVLHLHFELSVNDFGRNGAGTNTCSGVNSCGTCRLDPYGIYGKRASYPTSSSTSCGTTEYYWASCPPTISGGTPTSSCNNGSSVNYLVNGLPPTHPNGSIIKSVSGNTVYVLQGGRKLGIPSREMLNTLYGMGRGFDFRDVITVSQAEFEKYTDGGTVNAPLTSNGKKEPDGRLIKAVGKPEISIVTDNGQRRPFVSGDVFLSLGFAFCNVVEMSEADYNTFPVGAPVSK
jgi:Peptidase family M23